MTNETDYKFGVNDEPDLNWGERFVGYLNEPMSRVSVMVQRGVEQCLADDSAEGRKSLARDLGAVLDAVYDKQTGGEVCVDDLTAEQMEERTGILPVRQKGLVDLMVDAGMVKSRQVIETRRRVNGR